MNCKLIDQYPLESHTHLCELQWANGLVTEAIVMGTPPATGSTISGDLAIDEISNIRDADPGQALGISQGSGFLVLCAEYRRKLDDECWELIISDSNAAVVVDADELPERIASAWRKQAPEPGSRLSIAFGSLSLILNN